jgi:hypothetical protein
VGDGGGGVGVRVVGWPMPRYSLRTLLIVWLALVVLVGVGLGSPNWRAYHNIVARGVPCQALVIEIPPRRHGTVRYEYHVSGGTFEGQSQPKQPNPPLKQLKIGQTLTAYYDPKHPEISVLGDPDAILANETLFIVLAALGAPTVLILSSLRWASVNVTATVKPVATSTAP